jgi:hypothetical protein
MHEYAAYRRKNVGAPLPGHEPQGGPAAPTTADDAAPGSR